MKNAKTIKNCTIFVIIHHMASCDHYLACDELWLKLCNFFYGPSIVLLYFASSLSLSLSLSKFPFPLDTLVALSTTNIGNQI